MIVGVDYGTTFTGEKFPLTADQLLKLGGKIYKPILILNPTAGPRNYPLHTS
jgi:hypothetical protein